MKALVNEITNEIVACGDIIEDFDDEKFLIDREYGHAKLPYLTHFIVDVDKYYTPRMYMLSESGVVRNPRTINERDEEIEILKLMVADLALNAGGL